MPAKRSLSYFQALPQNAVDAAAGTINGVSLLTIGPALGHGIQIDQTGLEQCLAACQQRGNVRLIDRHDAEFEGIVGGISNFRIEGNQVKGDVSLLEKHPMRERILELAGKLASEFGLSIECDNQHVDNPNGEGKLFRCSEVDAVALVPRPAANKTGLFSAKRFDTAKKISRKFSKQPNMSKLKSALSKFAKLTQLEEGDELDNVLDAIVSAVQESQPSVEDRLKKLEEGAAPKPEPTPEEKAKLEEGEAKDKEEKDKADEEKMSKLATKMAAQEITKLASAMGVSRAPASGSGFVVQDDRSKLEAAISTQLSAGAANRAVAISRLAKDKPEIYNDARAKGLL